MADLEVTHISDLHWHSKSEIDTKIVIHALLTDLATTKRSGLIRPDILVFSGDLVLAGENEGDFELAFERLISPALHELGLDLSTLLICPGNHDLSRKTVRDSLYIDHGLRTTLSSVDEVNKLVDSLNTGDFSGFVVEMIIERMRAIVDSQFLDDKEHEKLHAVIDAAEDVLGWTNEQKGHVITDLRKARTQADLRDTL